MSKIVFATTVRAACALGVGLAVSVWASTSNAQPNGRALEPETQSVENWPEVEAQPTEAVEAWPQSPMAEQMAAWIAGSGDNKGLPFLIIDKVAALVLVYDPSGALQGATPALVGFAAGDDTVPGIGDRPLKLILPEEKTTPAGRFAANFGPAVGLGRVLWVDFTAAVALHAVPTANKAEKRLERLQSPSPDDNRITFGCINVPPEFYQAVVRPTFGDTKGVVYILPDTKPLEDVFPTFAALYTPPPPASPAEEVQQARGDAVEVERVRGDTVERASEGDEQPRVARRMEDYGAIRTAGGSE